MDYFSDLIHDFMLNRTSYFGFYILLLKTYINISYVLLFIFQDIHMNSSFKLENIHFNTPFGNDGYISNRVDPIIQYCTGLTVKTGINQKRSNHPECSPFGILCVVLWIYVMNFYTPISKLIKYLGKVFWKLFFIKFYKMISWSSFVSLC